MLPLALPLLLLLLPLIPFFPLLLCSPAAVPWRRSVTAACISSSSSSAPLLPHFTSAGAFRSSATCLVFISFLKPFFVFHWKMLNDTFIAILHQLFAGNKQQPNIVQFDLLLLESPSVVKIWSKCVDISVGQCTFDPLITDIRHHQGSMLTSNLLLSNPALWLNYFFGEEATKQDYYGIIGH